MTLKDEFKNIIESYNLNIDYDDADDICEKILSKSEEFSIAFAEYSCVIALRVGKVKLHDGELEKFKKEKGL